MSEMAAPQPDQPNVPGREGKRDPALGRVTTYTYTFDGPFRHPASEAAPEVGHRPVRVERVTYQYSNEPGVQPVTLEPTYYWTFGGKRIAEGPVLPADWQTNLTHDTAGEQGGEPVAGQEAAASPAVPTNLTVYEYDEQGSLRFVRRPDGTRTPFVVPPVECSPPPDDPAKGDGPSPN